MRLNNSEIINHLKLEGKKKNLKNKKDGNSMEQIEPKNSRTSLKLKKGLIIIPGLGRKDRLQIVQSNVRILVQSGILVHKTRREDIENKEMNGDNDLKGNKDYEKLWDCVIYIYTKKPHNNDISQDGFWNKTVEMTYLENFCEIVLNPGKLVSQNLHMVQPVTVQYSHEYVFILLDDCRLMSKKSNNSVSNNNSEKYSFHVNINNNNNTRYVNNKNDSNSNSNSISNYNNDKSNDTNSNTNNNNNKNNDNNTNNDTNNNNNNNNDNDNINSHKRRRATNFKNKEHRSFDLHKILRIMKFNNLSVASPQVRKYSNILTSPLF